MSTRVDSPRGKAAIAKHRANEKRKAEHTFRVMDLAYIRDGDILYTDEAVILACLVHSKGKGRTSPDMTDVQRIMRDKNLEHKQFNKKEV